MTSEHKVLLVEDNPATRKSLGSALSLRGHTVLQAADRKSALALMELHRPPLVLLDLLLPDGDGFSLVSELRSRAANDDTIIVALSGRLSQLDEARLAAVGFDEVIGKPVEPEWLSCFVETRLPPTALESDRFGLGKVALVVDDDPLQLKLIKFRLLRLGFDVCTAVDGEQALSTIHELRPDVLIADVLMPKLDGFHLAAAVRSNPVVGNIPVLLVTSSYVEAADRELARRAGASDLVVRTPELEMLVTALRKTVKGSVSERPLPPDPGLEHERLRTGVKQLERHVRLNSGLTQRCSSLAAELSVLTRATEAVLQRRDLDTALEEALTGCFDACGIHSGALYVLTAESELRALPLSLTGDLGAELDAFFGHAELVHRCMQTRAPLHIPSPNVSREVTESILSKCGSNSVLIVPLAYVDKPLGALAIVARSAELEHEDLRNFVQAVANQIALVLALDSAFSQRQAAEQVARERTSFLNAVLDQAPDFVLYVDPQGRVRHAACAAQHIEGDELLPQDHERYLPTVLGSGRPVSWEECHLAASGERTYYWYKMGPIHLEQTVAGAVIVVRDITEKKQLDEQLMASDRMASVGILAAGVAHEINNPLTSVLGNLELALDDIRRSTEQSPLLSRLAGGLTDAKDASERICTIVKDLKLFSRDSGEQLQAVNVEQVIDSTLRMASTELRNRATLIKDYGNVPQIAASQARLGQVVLNLVINAAQAIPEGQPDAHTIRVSTTVDAHDRVVISVSDTGCGIEPAVQSRLFTPFFTTKPIGSGTGLGLSICQRIVHSFGGEITVGSEIGRGSVFRVCLPITAPESRVRASANAVPVLQKARVLVIDDEEAICTLAKQMLQPECDVTTTTRAMEALDLIKSGERFDVILCDLMMPECDGRDFYSALCADNREQAERIAYVTGGAHKPWAQEFLDRGVRRTLDKPFSMRSLRALVVDIAGGKIHTETSTAQLSARIEASGSRSAQACAETKGTRG